MVALSGSGTPPVRSLDLYGTISDYLVLSDIVSGPCWELRLLICVGPVSVGGLRWVLVLIYILSQDFLRFASLCGVIP